MWRQTSRKDTRRIRRRKRSSKETTTKVEEDDLQVEAEEATTTVIIVSLRTQIVPTINLMAMHLIVRRANHNQTAAKRDTGHMIVRLSTKIGNRRNIETTITTIQTPNPKQMQPPLSGLTKLWTTITGTELKMLPWPTLNTFLLIMTIWCICNCYWTWRRRRGWDGGGEK